GDTIRAEIEIVSVTPSQSKPTHGVARMHVIAKNQKGDVVLSMYPNLWIARRPAQPEIKRAHSTGYPIGADSTNGARLLRPYFRRFCRLVSIASRKYPSGDFSAAEIALACANSSFPSSTAAFKSAPVKLRLAAASTEMSAEHSGSGNVSSFSRKIPARA